MIRILIITLFFLGLAIGFVWLADHPGAVTIIWFDKEIKAAIIVVIAALLLLIFTAVVLSLLIYQLWRAPQMLRGYFQSRRRDKGYEALSSGIIAVGCGDTQNAERAVLEAQKFLKNSPLTLLLKAQTAQLAGHYALASQTFHLMLENKETRLLGLRELFVEAERLGQSDAALQLAQRALEEFGKTKKRNSETPGVINWAGPAILRYQCIAEDWEGALKTIADHMQGGLLDRKQAKRKRAVILVAKALSLEEKTPQEAKLIALEAHKLAPELIPAAVVAGRTLSRLGELRRAVKVLEASWKINPHPEIADVYAHIRPGDGPHARVKRIKTLIRLSPDHIESAIALAKAALAASDWSTARTALQPYLKTPTQRICLMMADLEEGESADKGRMREWLAKAVYAAADPVWISDGIVFDHWTPISPISGELDTFEWTSPSNIGAKETLTLSDDDILLKPPAIKNKGIESDNKMHNQLDITASNVKDIPQKTDTKEIDVSLDKDEKPDIVKNHQSNISINSLNVDNSEAQATSEPQQKPEILSPETNPPAPDDPGPEEKDEQPDLEKRFRLF